MDMEEIGKNIKYEKFELLDLTNSILKIKNASHKVKDVDLSQIQKTEITGVKSNSGFSGTMEWGMKNPTFILPTNFIYNIFNLFKRKNDIVHIKITLKDDYEFVVLGTQHYYNELQKFLKT